jgi:CRP/FNR family transcriptional regulator, cyclic AMP receptor protein
VTPSAAELERIALFDSLSASDLDDLAPSFESRSVTPGTRLVGEGAPGYSFFALAEGEASVTVDGDEVATLGSGDCFGEIAMLDGGYRTATVTATTPARVYVMFGTEFRRLQQTQPEVAARLSALMRSRLHS